MRARKTTATATGRCVAKERTTFAPATIASAALAGRASAARSPGIGSAPGALSLAPESLAPKSLRSSGADTAGPLHHAHLGSGLQAGLPRHDHAVAGREGDALAPGRAHLDVGGVLEHGLDEQPLDGVVGLEAVHPGLVVVDQERALGQQQRVLA